MLGKLILWDSPDPVNRKQFADALKEAGFSIYFQRKTMKQLTTALKKLFSEFRPVLLSKTVDYYAYALVREEIDKANLEWHGRTEDKVTYWLKTGRVTLHSSNPEVYRREGDLNSYLHQLQSELQPNEFSRYMVRVLIDDFYATKVCSFGRSYFVPSKLCSSVNSFCKPLLEHNIRVIQLVVNESKLNKSHLLPVIKSDLLLRVARFSWKVNRTYQEIENISGLHTSMRKYEAELGEIQKRITLYEDAFQISLQICRNYLNCRNIPAIIGENSR